MRLLLSVICLLFAAVCFGQAEQSYHIKVVQPYKHPIPQQITLEKLTEKIKLIDEFGLLFVRATINGHGPYLFWLDTGSEISLISRKIVDESKMPLLSKTKHKIQASYSIQSLESHFTVAPTLKMSGVTFTNAPFITVDPKHQAHRLFDNLNVAGLLGINLFHGVTISINLSDHTMLFQKNVTPSENVVKLRGRYFFPVISAAIRHENKLTIYPFLIDTGFNGGIEMPDCNRNRKDTDKSSHSLDFFNKTEKGFITQINGHIQVGSMIVKDPIVRYAESNCRQSRPFGLIGTQFLKDKTLTINLEKRMLSIH